MNYSIRPMEIIIDGVIIVIGVWAYGKYMYMKGKIDGKLEVKKEEK